MTPPLRLVFRESTEACNLTCKHCRSVPQKQLGPGEIKTDVARGVPPTVPVSVVGAPGHARPVLICEQEKQS